MQQKQCFLFGAENENLWAVCFFSVDKSTRRESAEHCSILYLAEKE